MTSPDLMAFLNARLDEDEAVSATFDGPHFADCDSVVRDADYPSGGCDCGLPGRWLREVEAKRRILARYEFARNQVAVGAVNEAAGYGPGDEGWPLRADSHDLDVCDLAAVYSDHPDYDKAWAKF